LEVLRKNEERKVVNPVTPNVCDRNKSGRIGNDKVSSKRKGRGDDTDDMIANKIIR
jgi:hypothetical protein